MRVAMLFDSFGPYHLARLRGCGGVVEVQGVAGGSVSGLYAWRHDLPGSAGIVVVNESGAAGELSRGEFRKRLVGLLERVRPDVVAVPGWSDRLALEAVLWAEGRGCPVVTMSDSTEWDSVRKPVLEWVKRRVLGLSSAALVAGGPHGDYVRKLGMSGGRVFDGFDVVDNGYFEAGVAAAECGTRGGAGKYFLVCGRFIPEKNLMLVLEAYRRYCGGTGGGRWPLVLVGGGALEGELMEKAESLGCGVVRGLPWEREGEVERAVYFAGFRQVEELPGIYAGAGVLVHASVKDTWGLVVNEAMASGLPVIVSGRCGCASDLVRDGENGYVFEPTDVEGLAGLMGRVARMPEAERAAMGEAGRRVIAEWGPERFAAGLKGAAEKAMEEGPKRAGVVDRMILNLLCRR
ncbi:MAG: Glycosyltransferase involved in cell wall bisynthesis [Verrucomicrobia bacterium]|nr:MAG: Glycosyltransferase involved in cell wall bisynthesis [Verrucomicrobiota bacterium]